MAKLSDDIIWNSNAAEDYIFSLSDNELVDELLDTTLDPASYLIDFPEEDIDFTSLSDDELYSLSWDYDEIRNHLLPDFEFYDPDYEELDSRIIPNIEDRCYNGELWLIGNYQRWDGGHSALKYITNISKELVDICYPNYDTKAIIYDDNGNLAFTEYSHDAPVGGTSMIFYSFKDQASYDKAVDEVAAEVEEDWGYYPDMDDLGEDPEYLKRWIDEGLLTPISANGF